MTKVQSTGYLEMVGLATMDLVMVHGARQEIVFASPAVEQVLGYAPHEVLGMTWNDFLHEDMALEMDLETLRRFLTRRDQVVRLRVKRKNGQGAWLEIVLREVEQPITGELVLVSSARDVTETVDLTEDLMMALAREKEISELRNSLFTITSHEFKTPLTVIQSHVDVLRLKASKAGDVAQQFKKSLEVIESEVEKLTGFIQDLLTLRRQQLGENPFHPEPLQLKRVIEDVLRTDIRGKFPKMDIAVESLDQVAEVVADLPMMRYTFANLLSNACKYSGSSNRVEVSLRSDGQQVTVDVRDFGIGIAAKDQARLFQAFFRGSNTENISGTGVGLSIIKEFVDLHQGKILVNSKLGQGTVFSVILPHKPNPTP
jgi:PAS domain S-box-containing protein